MILASWLIAEQDVGIMRRKDAPKLFIDRLSIRRNDDRVRASPEFRKELDDPETVVVPVPVGRVREDRDAVRSNTG